MITAGPTIVGPTAQSALAALVGPAGESAYALAVDNGYTGTVQQWLASLVGPAGSAGSLGPAGPANNLVVGTIQTSAPGTQAVVTLSGTSPNQFLNMTIPAGSPGSSGPTGPQPWQSPPVAWLASTVYTATPPASCVTYNGGCYVCSTSHTSSTSFDASKWMQIAAAGTANNAVSITPQTLTAGQQAQALANLALSATNFWMTEIQVATSKGSYFGLLDGIADGFADSSGIDTANAVNANVQGGTVLNIATDLNAKALLHFDGANNSTTFTDAAGHTFSPTGAAKISTTQSKFGGSALSITNTTDALTSAASTDFNVGTGDYTHEGWIYLTQLASSQSLFSFGTSSNYTQAYYGGSTGTVYVYNNGSVIITGSTVLAANTWYHVAVSRASGTTRLFVNGVLNGTAADTNNLTAAGGNQVIVGNSFAGNAALASYFDEYRFSNIARYTAAFTPPAAAFNYGTSGALTLPSIGYALQSIPTKGSIRIRAKATANTITPNTNFIASLSRNGTIGGGNSVDVSLALTATLPDGYSHFEANEVDLTGLTSGLTLKGQLRTVGTSLGVAVKGWRILGH
jgi:hypothetical protein